MMHKTIYAVALAGALAGCSASQLRDDKISREVEQSVLDAETRARESRTLSSLAKLEEAVAAFVSREHRIPNAIDDLVPKYLAEIPSIDIDARGHRENNLVRSYPSDVLRGGQIDGSRLKDTGRWGYVHSDHQVVIFIDCTHQSRRGHPWYQEHGVY